jgi:hypothetical protein
MKLLILDALTQTVDIDKPFTSGVIRAALNDSFGMAYGGYDVTYVYYGKEVYDKPFKTFSLGNKGLKDHTWNNTQLSGITLNKCKDSIFQKLFKLDFDHMIIHLHSYSSYITDLCKYFKTIPKVFVIHDFILDVFTASNMMKKMLEIKKYPNTIIISNSSFTQYLGNFIYKKRYEKIKTVCPEILNLDFDQSDKFVDRAWNYFIFTTQKEPLGFENKNYSVNIGRFDGDKRVQRLLKLHKYNDFKVKLFGSYDPYHDPNKIFYNKLKQITDNNPNSYEVCEGYSDEQLKDNVKYANNIVITCEHEGFGYTAYEMGLLGIPSIVIVDKKFLYRHATSDYLRKINVPFKEVHTINHEELYSTMKSFKISVTQKKDLSKQIITYFSLNNFIIDRLNAFKEAKKRIVNNEVKSMSLF